MAWVRVKENKSSSVSGWHYGTYNAITRDPSLLQVFTNALNIEFLSGLPYERWGKFLNVMTLKEPGNQNVEKLRSLVLGEADWNLGFRIHINRRMLHNADSYNEIPPEHYGGCKHKKSHRCRA